MSIGDVLIFLSIFFGLAATLWSLLVVLDLLFSARTAQATERLSNAPWKCFWVGLVVAGIGVATGLGLLNAPGILKIAGVLILGGLVVLAALGSAGLARLVAMRMTEREPYLKPLPAYLRGAGLLIAVGMMPVVGWFFAFPILLLLSVGAGVSALRKPQPIPAAQVWQPPQS
jgi:amino acid transporter